MKKLKPAKLIYFLVLGFVLYQIVPRTMQNFETEGQSIDTSRVQNVATNEVISFPPAGKSIAIFWATWCAPCKLEMKRLKSSVESGAIPKDKIFAINPFEGQPAILKFLKSEPYPFVFIEAPELVSKLKVEVTPTTLFIEEGKILSRSSGLSLIGIWRAESLFR